VMLWHKTVPEDIERIVFCCHFFTCQFTPLPVSGKCVWKNTLSSFAPHT
jgi:hypothetical protein